MYALCQCVLYSKVTVVFMHGKRICKKVQYIVYMTLMMPRGESSDLENMLGATDNSWSGQERKCGCSVLACLWLRS